MSQPESTPIASTEAPWDTDSDEGFFDETECDTTPAVNPAAQNCSVSENGQKDNCPLEGNS